MMNLTPTQVKMMIFISECPTPLRPAQIHYSTKIPYQTVKQYLLLLYNAGLLKKPITFSYVITIAGKKAIRKSMLSIKRKKLFESLECKEKKYRHAPPKASFLRLIKAQGMKVEKVTNMPNRKTLEHYRIYDSKGLHGWIVVNKKKQTVLNWHIR